jgi:putative FmdB family regulatory protein
MPTYVYELDPESKAEGCAHCREHFETVQRMSAEPLSVCPECNAPVRKCIQAPMVGHEGMTKGPSEKRIKDAGFTQFKRKGKGYYEKNFGKGPGSLHG